MSLFPSVFPFTAPAAAAIFLNPREIIPAPARYFLRSGSVMKYVAASSSTTAAPADVLR